MNSIPIDLILEISSRLPAKSIARFRCVSKLWGSLFHLPYFTELFLTKSLARPRLLFALKRDVSIDRNCEWIFFSSPQTHNPYEKASLLVAADSHLKSPQDTWLNFCGYASGLICFSHHIKEEEDLVHVICNPSTGQYASLPSLRADRNSRSYLGFDPIDKQFKVLSMAVTDNHRILSLENGKMSWRNIQCPGPGPLSLYNYNNCHEGICINGVLYYFARFGATYVLVCFDVRSEKYKSIETNYLDETLINYKGKLCGIRWCNAHGGTIELYMWALEDGEIQKASNYVYTLQDDKYFDPYNRVSVAGVTAAGEIVLSTRHTRSIRKPFRVFYFNPERNTLQRVEIQGFGDMFYAWNNEVYTFVDHVEDLKFNIMKTTYCCNIYQPPMTGLGTFKSINKFDALCLSDDD